MECDECDVIGDIRYIPSQKMELCRPCFNDLFYEFKTSTKEKFWNRLTKGDKG